MISFNQEFLEMFLGVVRKYMQLRGGLSQKELAEKVNAGISTMSRFLNQKTKELDPQLIAAIVAKLNIPLHEIIDFVEEDSTAMFKKMVLLYKDEQNADQSSANAPVSDSEADRFEQKIDTERTKQKTSANIRGVNVPFGGESDRRTDDRREEAKSKRAGITGRQQDFLNEFLDLDTDGRDLVVSTGEVIIKFLNRRPLKL